MVRNAVGMKSSCLSSLFEIDDKPPILTNLVTNLQCQGAEMPWQSCLNGVKVCAKSSDLESAATVFSVHVAETGSKVVVSGTSTSKCVTLGASLADGATSVVSATATNYYVHDGSFVACATVPYTATPAAGSAFH